ncbi:MAG: UbiA prenyltransferase family protein [Candidatus Hermodarchaeota archaeon]
MKSSSRSKTVGFFLVGLGLVILGMLIEFILGSILPNEVMQWLYVNGLFLILIILLLVSGLLFLRRSLLGHWRYLYDSIIYLIACVICLTSAGQTILGLQAGHPWLELADSNPILMNVLWMFILPPLNPFTTAALGLLFSMLAWVNYRFEPRHVLFIDESRKSEVREEHPYHWWELLGGLTRVSVWLGSIFLLILSFLILGSPPLSLPPNIPLYVPLTWIQLLIGIISVSLLNSAAFIVNQMGDVDTDRLHSEKAKLPISSGRIKRQTVGLLVGLFAILGIVLARVVGVFFFGVMLFIFIFAASYSFPPIRLKGRPIFDLVIIGFAFGTWAVLAAWAVLASLPFIGTGPGVPFVLLLGAGLFYAGTHGIHTASDYQADAQAGVKTSAVFLGPNRASKLGIVLIALGMLLLYVAVGYFTHLFWYGLLKYRSIFLLIFCGLLFFALLQRFRIGLQTENKREEIFWWLQRKGRMVSYLFFLILVIYLLFYVFLFYPVYYPSYLFPWG